jgi:hypothetical protein
MAMPLIRRNLDLKRVIISYRALARAPFHSEPSKHKGNASPNNYLGASRLPNTVSISKGTNNLKGMKIELLDSELFWAPSVFADVSRVSSDCSGVSGNHAEIQLKEAPGHHDIDKLEDMRSAETCYTSWILTLASLRNTISTFTEGNQKIKALGTK